MDSNFRFRAFLSLRSSSVFSIPRSRSAEGTDAESGTEAISLKPSSGKNRVGSRSLSAAHDPKLVAFPVYTSVGPSNVSRIFSSTVAPTNAFPWRKPDAIHRRYLVSCVCRRKIEMSLGVQSRDDTRVPDGHEEERLGLHLGRGVEQRI